jgi:hypothetical protein
VWVKLTNSAPSESRESRICGNLDVSQENGAVRPLTEIALPFNISATPVAFVVKCRRRVFDVLFELYWIQSLQSPFLARSPSSLRCKFALPQLILRYIAPAVETASFNKSTVEYFLP